MFYFKSWLFLFYLLSTEFGTSSINAAGNPYLGPALANNFDIGGSVFSNDVGLFTADFFYKDGKELADKSYERGRFDSLHNAIAKLKEMK